MAEAVRQEKASVRERFTTLYASHLDAAARLYDQQVANEMLSVAWEASHEELVQELARRRMDAMGVLLADDTLRTVGDPAMLSAALAQDIRHWPQKLWLPVPERPGELLYHIRDGEASLFFLRRRLTLGREAAMFFQTTFGAEPEVMVFSPEGRQFPSPVGRPLNEDVILTKNLSNSLPGWQVSLIAGTSTLLTGTLAEQVRAYQRIGIILVIGILGISIVAGFAVTRQMRYSELQLTGIAVIAHELKTPLASMRLLLDTLADGRLESSEARSEYLGMVCRENDRLSRVVDGLLTLGRVQSRNYRPQLRPVRTGDIIQSALASIRLRCREADVVIHTEESDPDATILADADAIVTALVNLLENAIKYSGDSRDVQLTTRVDGGWWSVSIRDHGIGMPGNEMRRIFRPFYQLDAKLSRRSEGSGLGLSIVRRIVQSHSGKITVESELGRGSRFTIRLPAHRQTI